MVEQLQVIKFENNRSYVFYTHTQTRICRIHSDTKEKTRKAILAEIPNLYMTVMNVNFIQLLVYSVQVLLQGWEKNHVNGTKYI